MPVVLLAAAVLLSFVLVLPLVVAWLPVTLHGALLFLERGWSASTRCWRDRRVTESEGAKKRDSTELQIGAHSRW